MATFQTVALPEPWTRGSLYFRPFSDIAPFFPGGDPRQKDTYGQRQAYLQQHFPAEVRAHVAGILWHYNRALGAGEASLTNARKLTHPGTLAVVTGQQAGLLTGPLYTVYKAMTAIALARQLSRQLGCDVVPVFWIASEDHDFQEVNHVHILSDKNRLHTVYLSYPLTGQPPVQEVKTGPACRRFLQDCLQRVRTGPYLSDLAALLEETLDGTGNICDWFGSILLRLFAGEGLVCLNPMLPELRQLQKPVFRQGLETAKLVNDLLADNAAALAAHGFSAAVQKKAEHTHLFFLQDGQRLPVYLAGAGCRVGDRHFSLAELTRLVEERPELFSPDVILRPVSQEVILPVLAYVAGPGEVDYWAQLGDIFRAFDLQMPPVFPRASFTLVEPEMEILLAKYRLGPGEIFGDLAGILEEWLARRDPAGLPRLFAEGQGELERTYRELLDRLPVSLKEELEAAWRGSWERTLRHWRWLQSQAAKAHRRQNRDLIHDFRRVERELLPLGQRQENIYNFSGYYTRYGPDLLKALEPGLLAGTGHQLVFLGGAVDGTS